MRRSSEGQASRDPRGPRPDPDQALEAGPARGGTRDLVVATLTSSAASLPVFLAGSLAVQIRASLHFGTGALGLAVALYYLGAAAVSVPASHLAERIGGIRVVRVGTILVALVLVGFGPLAGSFGAFALLLLLAGVLGGSMQPALNLFLARRVLPGRQGTAFGIKQAAVPLASTLGGLAVPAIALTLGWRYAFALGGALAIGAAIAVPRPSTSLAARRQSRTDERVLLPIPGLVTLSLGLGLGMLAASGLAAFLVTFAVASGIGKADAGLVAALAGSITVFARVFAGTRADRRGGRHLRAIAMMLAGGTAGFVVLALAAATGTRCLVVVGAVLALGIGWGWNGLFNLAVVRSCPDAPARATGIAQVGGRLGGVSGPIVVGLLIGHESYAAAWAVCAAITLCASATMLTGRRLLRVARSTSERAALRPCSSLGPVPTTAQPS